MAHSNSSLNCFANCQMRYKLNYVDHVTPDIPPSVHLQFGAIAHEVLYKAGKLRDESDDGLLNKGDYEQVIPSEVLYPDLKTAFNINNWQSYFTAVIKQCTEYEQDEIHEIIKSQSGNVRIERELKLSIPPEELHKRGVRTTDPLVGIIDLLILTDTHATIIDYKFSSSVKTQDDFDLNSQLSLYALLVHYTYNIPVHNIRYGYIDIPKKAFDRPTLLSNGTLSRSKSQNVSQDMYKMCVEAIHGNDPYYNCNIGGYYYDAWCSYALNKAAYLSMQWLDIDVYNGITQDLFDTISQITIMHEHNMPYLKKYDSYSCKSCEYLHSCKKWLNVGDK